MKKKIEISIVWVIFYIALLLLVSGFLVYKTFFEKLSGEEIREELREELPKIVSEKKKESIPVIEQKADTLKVHVKEEFPDTANTNTEATEAVPEVKILKELEHLQIPQTKSLFNSSSVKLADFPEGKLYYDGDNGKLESKIIQGEKEVSETLTGINYNGEKVDELEIGLIDENQNVKKFALIFRNKISVFERIGSDRKDGKQEERVTEYLITPELKFIKGKTYSKVL